MAIDAKGDVLADDLTHLSEKEMDEQAEIFSESSPALKETLKVLWSNGIQTIACCSGHEGQGYPYIAFYTDNLSEAQVRKILTEICSSFNEVLDVRINKGRVVSNNIREDGEIVSKEKFKRPFNIGISFEKDKGFDQNFFGEILKDVIEKTKEAYYYQKKYDNLSEKDINFIEDCIAVKNSDIKVDLSNEKNLPKNTICDDTDIHKSKAGISYENGIKKIDGEYLLDQAIENLKYGRENFLKMLEMSKQQALERGKNGLV